MKSRNSKKTPKKTQAVPSAGRSYDWRLSAVRLSPTTVQAPRDLIQEFLSDRARLDTSNAFRRMQAKAQVFSLEENAAVRTRLTHSMEVASLGAMFARQLAVELSTRSLLSSSDIPAFQSLVENACLAHDIGNPPFGHFGEYAIARWFRTHQHKLRDIWNKECDEKSFEHYMSDFLNFDGNAQGFRILTRLQWHHHVYGLNLTCSLLCTFLKYLSAVPDPSRGPLYKKPGYFRSEADLVERCRHSIGIASDQRHPLTYLLEAADDIAYALSDLEDGLEKELLAPTQILDEITRYVSSHQDANVREEAIAVVREIRSIGDAITARFPTIPTFPFIDYKIRLSQWFGSRAVKTYIQHVDEFYQGRAESLFSFDRTATLLLQAHKQYAKRHLFRSKAAVDVELHGSSVIMGLLDGMVPLLELSRDQFTKLDPNDPDHQGYGEKELEKRLYSLLPSRYLLAYHHHIKSDASHELFYRMHLIVDYVSGMTDSHALKIFKLIEGISISNR
jgi:dGTPase